MPRSISEWPDIIEDTGKEMCCLTHTFAIRRAVFNERMGMFVGWLLRQGTLEIKSTKNVRRYTLEFEILDDDPLTVTETRTD